MKPPLTLLTEALERASASNPDSVAVSMAGKEVSYLELDGLSNSVANMLIDKGVRRHDRVAIYAHKSIDVVAALYGVMKAGAAYVPINPDAPYSYVVEILRDCAISHLITGESKRRAVLGILDEIDLELCAGLDAPGGGADFVTWDEVREYSDARLDLGLTGDDLAYIIFTSGSTGKPKGIVHTHRSALAYAEVASRVFGFESSDRITNHAPLNFDLCTLELFGGAVAGSAVVIVPEAYTKLPASFTQLLEDERVTVINAVPFALVQMLHRGVLDERDLSSVRWVLFGGEVFPTKDLRSLMQRMPGAKFGNVYGPAEVNGCTYYIVPELPPDSGEPISIGRLYPGMDAMVVDEADREVGLGEPGELLIRSDAHMLEYWNQPAMTEQSRLRRLGSEGQELVFYRTGDVVERLEGGRFRLLGRKDRQIKTRGHRVELDEVEAVLSSHPDVEQVVVFAFPDGDGSQQIQAVVVLRPGVGEATQGADLRQHAARRLPRYALPSEVRVADAIPRTSSGKPDRVSLSDQAISTHQPKLQEADRT